MRKERQGVVVEDKSVFLRRVSKQDFSIYFRWYKDLEVQRFMANPAWSPGLSRDDYRDLFLRRHLLQTGTSVTLTICLAESGLPVGLVNLFDIDRDAGNCELGVVVGEKRLWRKGIATAAVKMATAYAFRNVGLSALYCSILPENRPSLLLFEKCGFVYQETVQKSGVEFLRYRRLKRPPATTLGAGTDNERL